ncbi:acyltransferase family protein [Methylocapsa palsarum]|nr:acyltransferase [Methylocapsa palsarum]
MARLVLALGVLCFHSIITSYGQEAQDAVLEGPFKPLFLATLPMFFALSGFLIAGSLTRVKSLKTFIVHRVLRIVPALSCEVFLSALILGPIVTVYTLPAYFSDRGFFEYFFNIIGKVRYYLPGVFLDNPLPSIVNFSLWTVPIEIQCYIGISILILLGVAANKRMMLVVFVGAVLVQAAGEAQGVFAPNPKDIVTHYTLFVCFIGGVATYLWRDHIKLTYFGVVAALIVMAASFYTGAYYFPSSACAAYLVVCFGMTAFPRIPLLSNGDYSYGIYLYGCPVQQTLMHYFPGQQNWAFNLALAMPLSVALAYLSWNMVEKHALYLKDHPQLQRFMAYPARDRYRAATSSWRRRLIAAAGRGR